MKKIIVSIIVIGLLLSSISLSFGEELLSNEIEEIFKEIEETEDKALVVDKIIGDRHVKYWEHVVNDVFVKNDSILLHLDPETGDILKYEKSWTNVELDISNSEDNILPTKDYFWKKAVVFPDEDDSGIFCTFYVSVDYPLVCWEVRYVDGTTILYDLNGERIGREVQAPTIGLAVQGHDDPDWRLWRENAQGWYDRWCDHVNSMSCPDNDRISRFLKMPDCSYFYVIAHSDGESTRFRSSGPGVYYTASQLHEDMKDRSPYRLAVLCCCSAMDDTGPGTLSYEFRKGQMADTVTIGYYDMGSCPGWPWDVLDWQDFMFRKMDQGYKMKKAFDLACAKYPSVDGYVKFVGDRNIKTCFLAGTEITMADGSYKNIEDIRVGDLVKSYDLASGETTTAKVTKVYHHEPWEMTDHYLIINNQLKVTPNHLLYIDGILIPAGEAQVGNLFTSSCGSDVSIDSIQQVFEQVPTYNFELESNTQMYFAGEEMQILALPLKPVEISTSYNYNQFNNQQSNSQTQQITSQTPSQSIPLSNPLLLGWVV